MRKLIFLVSALALTACAEVGTPDSDSVDTASETVTMGQTAILVAGDGTVFEISVVHDGSITPVEEQALIESIEVIGITPAQNNITPVSAGADYVPPVNPDLVPDEVRPVNIYIVGVEGDLLLGNYRWDWIDDIDQDQIEAFIEDICPPWH